MSKPATPWTDAVEDASESAALRQQLTEANARLALYERIRTVPSHEIASYKPSAGQAVAIALLSDCHWEERVDPEDVPGAYNVYTPAIAKIRAEQFAQRVVLLTESQRHIAELADLLDVSAANADSVLIKAIAAVKAANAAEFNEGEE